MADISKCANKECPIKEKCKRWMISPSYHQAYMLFKFKQVGTKVTCENYWKWEK